MGFRAALLLACLLLVSCGNHRAASHADETLTRIPHEQVVARSPQGADLQSNRTEPAFRLRSPVSYQLRSNQLRSRESQTSHSSQGPQSRGLTSDQLEPRDTVHAVLVPGPDLNPHVKQQSKVQRKLEQREPARPVSPTVHCAERKVTVEVKRDFLGNGQLIRPGDLTLGGCAASDATDHVLLFQSELHGCSSTMKMTEDALIYTFSLMYSPTPIGATSIYKTNAAGVAIECRYRRRQNVSSGAVRPSWTQLSTSVESEQQLHFSLRLMTVDWKSQRPSSVYFLGDVMHIEASVLQGHHVPLRVYVDSCVATGGPDPSSPPRYPFINNHGCLSDAKLTGAKSYFMQRNQEDKLQFLLKAFAFHPNHTKSLYIACHLKATTLSAPIDAQHKACSFLTEANRWVASGGDNKVCSCCESSCGEHRGRRSLAAHPDGVWEETVVLGPILLEENIREEGLTEASHLPPQADSLTLPTREAIRAAAYPSTPLLCGLGAALAAMLLVIMASVTGSRRHKSVGHTVFTDLGGLKK